MLACDQTQRHRHADAIAELATWVSWLEDQGRQSFLLLGHSRGTNQVARYATTESQVSPAGLILVAPPVWDAVAASDAYAERAGQPLEPLVARATQLVKSDQGDETLDDVVFLHCAEARVTAASFLSYYGMDPAFDTLALTDRSQLPVIIFAGTDDPLTRGLPPAVEAMDDGERVEFVTIEGADHFFRDLYAYDLVEAVEAWLTDRQM
jgi:pimeloyl-ACP methyl ester carboxylesterase